MDCPFIIQQIQTLVRSNFGSQSLKSSAVARHFSCFFWLLLRHQIVNFVEGVTSMKVSTQEIWKCQTPMQKTVTKHIQRPCFFFKFLALIFFHPSFLLVFSKDTFPRNIFLSIKQNFLILWNNIEFKNYWNFFAFL